MAAATEHADTYPGGGGHPRRWAILGVICLTQLTVLLDNTILNVAIPSLTRGLDASTADVQWMVNAYALVQSGLLLTAGNAADRYGRRRMLLLGIVLFGLGSLAAGLSGSSGELIAARAGMGVGGALLMTTTLAVVVQVFDEAERPKAIGIWGAVSSLGFAGGPLVGGVLLEHFWWGAIFLVNLPVVALALAAVVRLVPESGGRGGERLDVVGALLSITGMTAVVHAIISGPEHGWTSVRVSVGGALGVSVVIVFVLWERRVPHPMLDMGFFRDRRFVGAVLGGVLVAFGMAGSLFLLTQHLQFVLGYEPLEAGLRTAPTALTVVALNLSGVGARLLVRYGTPVTIVCGMALLSAGLVTVALLGADSYGGMLPGLVVMGAGIALAMPAMANAIMSAIPPERAGVGAGVNGTLAEFGNGLGVAVLGAVLNARFTALLPAVVAGAGSLPEALAGVRTGAERAAAREAFADGIAAGQLVGAVAVFVGGVLTAALLRRAERAGSAGEVVGGQTPGSGEPTGRKDGHTGAA
ncbi:MFS transporter [Streptomyces sp. TRM43335]|uniref:MFS transporter n=1 Tax=Streptomyces taklimakanensis TaxID=2569853 RepID=A0A6G2BCX8_9ACTN|nr:MFS transporter [Streptomyces taklimakanensis]MTE20108.1 MFS transporter [Streptomyces taklimakanensis]